MVALLALITLRLWLPNSESVGRYQLQFGQGGLVMLDTFTGRLWVEHVDQKSGQSTWVVSTPPPPIKTIEAGPNSSKPIAADQKLPELLALDQKGTSDSMGIEVVDAADNKLGKLQIVVRITNQSPTVVKRPNFSFALTDEFHNHSGIGPPGNAAKSLYPGKSLDERHDFDMPVAKAEYVILTVANQDGKHFDTVRFKIPKQKWTRGQ
jgi:hypothetical protein